MIHARSVVRFLKMMKKIKSFIFFIMLSVAATSWAIPEVEPNDDIAQNITSGEAIVGTISSTSDKDYYAIVTDSEGTLTVKFETDVDQYDGYEIFILDASGNVLASEICDRDCVSSQGESRSISVGLSVAGTYFVFVRSESSYTTPEGTYTMTATFVAGTLSGVEVEPNDDIAQNITSGEAIVGTISSTSDKDYYAIVTDSEGTLTVKFETDVDQYDGYEIFILDASGNVLASEICDRDCVSSQGESRSISVGLSVAGTYFVFVRSESSYTTPEGTYTMTATFVAGTLSGVEVEPNDDIAQNITSGEAIVGTISSTSDKDYYAIVTDSEGTLTVKFETDVDQYDGYEIFILDASGNVLASEICDRDCVSSQGESRSISVGLSVAGTYFVFVRSESSYTTPEGTYTMTATFVAGTLSGVEVEPNDDIAQNITSGEAIVGTISSTSDKDYYAIVTDSEGTLTVKFETDVDQYDGYEIFILDASGNVLASEICDRDCVSSQGESRSISVGLSVAGTYFVFVRSESSYTTPEGTYTMTATFVAGTLSGVEVEPNDDIAQNITSGEAIVGTISSTSDKDYYAIVTDSEGTLTVKFETDVDQYDGYEIFILDASGNVLASEICDRDCVSSQGESRSISVGLSVAGTYFVFVRSESSYTTPEGTYTMTATFVAGTLSGVEVEPNDDIAQNITSGEAIVGTISSTSDKDYYAIVTDSEGTLTVKFETDVDQYDGYEIFILDASGNVLASEICDRDCVSSQGESRSISVGLSVAGTYFVFVRSESSYTTPEGTYTMTATFVAGTLSGVEVEPNDDIAQNITSGEAIVGTISSTSDKDYYAIVTDSEGTLTVKFETDVDQYDGYEIFILDASGNVLASEICDRDCVSSQGESRSISVGLSVAGTYFVFVRSESSYTTPEGTYTMTATFVAGTLSGVEVEPNDDIAQNITSGEAIVGTISSSSDIDWYALAASGGGSLDVSMITEQANNSYYFSFYVFDSDNNILVSEFCGSDCVGQGKNITAGLKSAGNYFVGVVSDSSFGAPEGAYTLRATYSNEVIQGLEFEPNDTYSQAQSIFSSMLIKGSISSSDDLDWYTLSVSDSAVLAVSFSAKHIQYTDWLISYFDQNRNFINSISCGGTECMQTGVAMNINALGSGSVYLLVESASQTNYPYGEYELKVISSVLPDTPTIPTNLAASDRTSQNRISLTWDDEQSGNGYIVYRSGATDGVYTQIATTNVKALTDQAVIAGVDYYYKVKATNLAGESELSSSVLGRLADGPLSISDLIITSTGPDYAQLSFSAPSDASGSSTAVKRYEIRYSKYKITASNWASATSFNNSLTPKKPNSTETIQVTGLAPETNYWFGVKSLDQSDFISDISMIASASTSELISLSQNSFAITLNGTDSSLHTVTLTNLSSSASFTYESILSGVGLTGAISDSSDASFELQDKGGVVTNNKLPKIIPDDVYDWIIKFTDGVSNVDRQTIISDLTLLGGVLQKDVPTENMQLWRFPANSSRAFAGVLKFIVSNMQIEYIEPNYPISLRGLPDDPYVRELWGLKNTGQNNGLIGADIDIEKAWDITAGSQEVVVAVFDSGTNFTHPDLAENIWINEDEVPDNGIDDDRNGYIDDVRGWNYCSNNGDVRDDHDHGSHVAGTIGAVGGNGVGIVGVAPSVRIMTLKIGFGSGCNADFIDIKRALKYAADNGASIMNHSWGCANPGSAGCSESRSINEGIEYTQRRGLLFVQAAGNDSLNTDFTSADFWSDEYASIISVAATTRQDDIAEFSNYGRGTVDLGAPGTSILSTVRNNKYKSFSGTSMASPHVAGAAALIKAFRPNWSYSQIKSSLMSDADPLAALTNRTVSKGRLNIGESLSRLFPRWMSIVSGESGTIAPNQSIEVSFLVSGAGLPNGPHEGSIEFNFTGTSKFMKALDIKLNKGSLGQASGTSVAEFLQEPRNLSVSSISSDPSIDIDWDNVSGAVSYLVQRGLSLEGTYTDLASVTANKIVDLTAEAEQLYFYRVIANFELGSSAPSKIISASRSLLSADIEISTTKLESESYSLAEDIVIPITLLNKGPNTVENGYLKYSVPTGLEPVATVFSGGTCDEIDFSISCSVGSLKVNEEEVITVTLRPVVAKSYLISFRGFSSVNDPLDNDSSNNSLIVSTSVATIYDMSIEGELDQNRNDRAFFEVINNGPGDATDIGITFEYNGDIALALIPDQGSCSTINNVPSCALGDMESGSRSKIMVTQSVVENLILKASVSGEFDSSSPNNVASVNLGSLNNLDSDGDGVSDGIDAFPNNALYSADSDSDGMPDAWEARYGLDPNDASDATSDQDNDGVTALDEFLAGTIPSGSLDIDGNENYDALTDGLLLLRGMFGLDGSALVTGTIASDAAYTESVDIESRIATLGELADIDGNGQIDALTDGLLTLRYLFGLQGDTLINGVVAEDASRKTAEEIEAHLETLMPAL